MVIAVDGFVLLPLLSAGNSQITVKTLYAQNTRRHDSNCIAIVPPKTTGAEGFAQTLDATLLVTQ